MQVWQTHRDLQQPRHVAQALRVPFSAERQDRGFGAEQANGGMAIRQSRATGERRNENARQRYSNAATSARIGEMC